MTTLDKRRLEKILASHHRLLNDKAGERANLWGADLQGADLRGADLEGADLWGANLQRANLQRANLWGADLQRANLQRANLQGADLRGADLEGADLSGANLEGADLWGASLEGADLWGANLRRANLQGAKLDFSCFMLWCGSFDMKVDNRLVAQLFCHLGRLDVSRCKKEYREIIYKLPVDDFCEYRSNVKPVKYKGRKVK
jgi:hypothetical protein